MTLEGQLKSIKQTLEDIAQRAAGAANPNSYHSLAYRTIFDASQFDRQALIRVYYSKYHTYKELREDQR